MELMDFRRQCTVLLLICFLLTSCFCNPPIHSHRQKRGIMKMMMHIMWDPVRLIRYWYAYDVTKEIAKSWRKILPTILLLPITKNSPHSYSGIAKYVHPTVGFKDSKKNNAKYLNMPVEPHYQKSAGSIGPVAVPSKYMHQILPSPYPYSSDSVHQHHSDSKEMSDYGMPSIQHDYNNMPPVIVGHVPYEDNDKQHVVAHYYMKGNHPKEHQMPVFDNNAIYPGLHESIVHEDVSSSQYVPRGKKNRPGYSQHSENHIHYVPHIRPHRPTVHDDSEKRGPFVLQPGQEFHVVLHPIPVKDFDPSNLRPPKEEHDLQFVPIHPHSKESYNLNSPILFKAVSENMAESSNTLEHEHHEVPNFSEDPDSKELQIDRSGADGNVSPLKTRYNVTWVAQKGRKNVTPKKDLEAEDLNSDGTVRRVLSIHRFSDISDKPKKNCSLEKESEVRKAFGLHKYNINMEKLREDLKHGTPVLIPFNKNSFSPESLDNTGMTDKPEAAYKGVSTEVPIRKSEEQGVERENTQRLLLFLKKNNS